MVGCGGTPSPAANLPAAAPPTASAGPVAPPSASTTVPKTSVTAPPTAEHELVGASSRANPIRLEVVLPTGKQASEFPGATADDATCWKSVDLRGQHDKDYESVVSKCGEPTGMLPYTRRVESRMHDVSQGDKGDDKDFFAVQLRKGMCYRFYAIGDDSMVDLDMHMYRKGGALIATSETKSLALIMQSRIAMCVDDDEEWHFELDVNSKGKGRYTFAVWARPKK